MHRCVALHIDLQQFQHGVVRAGGVCLQAGEHVDYATVNGVSARGGAMEGSGPTIARGARTDSSCSEGRVNWNTAPRGSFAVTHSRPPCVSMIERQMARPIPMPSGLVV